MEKADLLVSNSTVSYFWYVLKTGHKFKAEKQRCTKFVQHGCL
jgi:hypothetical protein